MTAQPITIGDPTITPLSAGRVSLLVRPLGPRIAAARPGDRLWVREPFWLDAELDHFAPTQIAHAATGALQPHRPLFAAPLPDGSVGGVPGRGSVWRGKRRMARTLPRVWHRQHLVVRAVDRHPVQAVTEDQARALGFDGRAGFALAWGAALHFPGARCVTTDIPPSPRRWADNPIALWIAVDHVPAPLPTPDTSNTRNSKGNRA